MQEPFTLWWRTTTKAALPLGETVPQRRRPRRVLATAAAATALAFYVLIRTAEGGGTIGWADAVGQFSDEGAAVGALAVILGVMAVGAIVMFGITGLITTVVMVCLGGALMGQAEAVGQTLFGAGTGGGSIHGVTVPGGKPG